MRTPTPSVLRTRDGVTRCWWADANPLYRRYHDREWGRPVASDRQLFEKLAEALLLDEVHDVRGQRVSRTA